MHRLQVMFVATLTCIPLLGCSTEPSGELDVGLVCFLSNSDLSPTVFKTEVLWEGRVIGMSDPVFDARMSLAAGGSFRSDPGTFGVTLRLIQADPPASARYSGDCLINSVNLDSGVTEPIHLGPTEKVLVAGGTILFTVTLH